MNAVIQSRTDTQVASTDTIEAAPRQLGLNQFGITQTQAEYLVEMLGRSTQVSRRLIVNALRQLGEAAIPVLARQLGDSRVVIRQAAVDALRQMDNPIGAANALLIALFDSDWLVRIRAAEALGQARPKTARVIAALRHAQHHDPLIYVRLSAETALRKIALSNV